MAWLPAASASQTATSLTAAPPGAAEGKRRRWPGVRQWPKRHAPQGMGAAEHAREWSFFNLRVAFQRLCKWELGCYVQAEA